MITILHVKTFIKKAFLWAKKFWWAIIIALLFVCGGLLSIATRNAGILSNVLDLLDAKRNAHDQEMDALAHLHNNEITEKNLRLQEHLKRTEELRKQLEDKGESLNKEKEAELKKMVDEGYNDPEKLAKQIADAFGL
jgi:hypothetical protein